MAGELIVGNDARSRIQFQVPTALATSPASATTTSRRYQRPLVTVTTCCGERRAALRHLLRSGSSAMPKQISPRKSTRSIRPRRQRHTSNCLVGPTRDADHNAMHTAQHSKPSRIAATSEQIVLDRKTLHHLHIFEINDRGAFITKPLRMASKDNNLQWAYRWSLLRIAFGGTAENRCAFC